MVRKETIVPTIFIVPITKIDKNGASIGNIKIAETVKVMELKMKAFKYDLLIVITKARPITVKRFPNTEGIYLYINVVKRTSAGTPGM